MEGSLGRCYDTVTVFNSMNDIAGGPFCTKYSEPAGPLIEFSSDEFVVLFKSDDEYVDEGFVATFTCE